MAYFKKHLDLLILLVIGIAAFIRGIMFLDPDFGWHLRMGQLILQKGIPLTDPFSYTMPSYHFVDHEWLTNIFLSLGYKTVGILGLSLVFSLIFMAALFLVIPPKFKNYAPLPLALAGATMLGFSGIRTQLVTWFFLALLLRIIFTEKLWQRWKLLIPLLFVLWANLHGGFAVGIMLLFAVFIFKTLQKRKIEWQILVITSISLLVTLINPYGVGLWHEIWMVESDNFARWRIAEWFPGIFYLDIAMLCLFTLSFSFILRYRESLGGLKIFVYLLLLFMAASSLRHVPLWALSAIPLTAGAINCLNVKVGKKKEGKLKLAKLKTVLTLVIGLILVWEIGISINGAYNFSEQKYYPVQAVNFLSKQSLKGNLFASYNYGGYLIWKLPQKKVFIDGRMPSWRRTGVYPNEANYIFKDFVKMSEDKNYFKQMLQKYHVQYVLLPVAKTANNKDILPPQIRKIIQNILWGGPHGAVFTMDLSSLGMKKIYNDGQFVIYKW